MGIPQIELEDLQNLDMDSFEQTVSVGGFEREIDAALCYDCMARFLDKDEEELNFPYDIPIPVWIIHKAYEALMDQGIAVTEDELNYQISLNYQPQEQESGL